MAVYLLYFTCKVQTLTLRAASTANIEANDYVCMSGYYALNGDCVQCGPGKYKASVSNDACR